MSAPEDAVAPWEPSPVHWYDDSDDDEVDDELAWTRCGGEGFAEERAAEIDLVEVKLWQGAVLELHRFEAGSDRGGPRPVHYPNGAELNCPSR